MAKRTTGTAATSTMKRETTTAPKRVQRDASAEAAFDDVARRAYEKFLARGGQHGHDVEDWLAAEAEVRGSR